MTEDELIAALDRYGADLETWPPNDAAMARELLVRSPDAKRLHREALTISRLLDASLPATDPDLGRMRRELFARIDGTWVHRALVWLTEGTSGWARAWRPAMLALVPLFFGYALGIALPDQDEGDAEMAEAVDLFALQEATYEEYTDAQ
jgi:hypothetical protein